MQGCGASPWLILCLESGGGGTRGKGGGVCCCCWVGGGGGGCDGGGGMDELRNGCELLPTKRGLPSLLFSNCFLNIKGEELFGVESCKMKKLN